MQIILLNQDNKFHAYVTTRRAISLLRRKVVEVLHYSDKIVKTIDETIRLPKIMRLLNFVKYAYRKTKNFKKEFVFMRDGYICQYCGSVAKEVTVDHVIPRDRGGKSVYDNCVTACQECNHKKRNRTPEEAGLKLKKKPFIPSVSFIKRKEREQVEEQIGHLLTN